MKLLIVSQYFWPESFRINELANSLRLAGCEITVLTGQPNYPEGTIHKGYKAYGIGGENYNGYRIHRVPLIPRGKSGGIRLFLNYISFMVTATLFGPWMLRGEKFDAILVYAPSPILQAVPAILLKWLKRAPLFTWVGDLWPESLASSGFIKNKTVLKLVEYITRIIYRYNDVILVQSKSFLAPVKALAGKVPVEYFPNPGESIFTAFEMHKPSGLVFEKPFNVVFAGNLGGVQALDTLLDAAEMLTDNPDIHFTLVGAGSKTPWLIEQMTARNIGNVSMPGRYAAEYMPDIYKQADVLLVSLISHELYRITVPSKVQSYMAAGKPIICALEGEGASVVKESGAGIVIPLQDAKALAEAVLSLYRMPQDKRDSLGKAGRQYYQQHYNSDSLSRQLIDRINLQRSTVRAGL